MEELEIKFIEKLFECSTLTIFMLLKILSAQIRKICRRFVRLSRGKLIDRLEG